MAYNYGLLSMDCELLLVVVAHCFGLLGFPGTNIGLRYICSIFEVHDTRAVLEMWGQNIGNY